LRGQLCAVPQGPQFCPDYILSDASHTGRRVETAICASKHSAWVVHHGRDALNAVSNDFGMLDEVCKRVDHASYEDLVATERDVRQDAEFMRVSRVGERQKDRARLRMQNSWKDVA